MVIVEKVRDETGLVYRLLIDEAGNVEGVVVTTTIQPDDKDWLMRQTGLTNWVEGDVLGTNDAGQVVREYVLTSPGKSYAYLKAKYRFAIPWARR